MKCFDHCDGAPPCGGDPNSLFTDQNLSHDECCDLIGIAAPHCSPLSLREAIGLLIEESERELIPKFLRLGFHDCVGGCDGCVDLNNPDNNGLLEPIEEIADIVEAYKEWYSRADVWAMATLVSADKSLVVLDDDGNLVERRPEGITFPMTHIGRKDCEGADHRGIGGPEVDMPSNDLSTHELLEFFSDEFSFDADETVAIMGAHSVAVAHRENVGFGNLGVEQGWVCLADEYILDNRFYDMLVGDEGDEVNTAPNWELEFVNNTEIEGDIPNRYQWANKDKCEEERPIMTNADMALVRDFSDYISTDENGTTGKVNCTFKDENKDEPTRRGLRFEVPAEMAGEVACPVASETIDIVMEYKLNNTLFLYDFQSVLGKMVNNGYADGDLEPVDL